MRTLHLRPLLLLSWFLMAGSDAIWAQGDPGGQFFFQREIPVPYGDPNQVPGYSGLGPGGYPPGMNAWPEVSPYGPAINQHYVQNGFWFNRIISGNSQYYFSLDALITGSGAPPHALVGADGVNPVPPELLLEGVVTNNTIGTRTGPFFETIGRLNNPDRRILQTTTGGGNNGQNGSVIVPAFPFRNAGALQQHIGSGGIRGNFGWWNPDQSGMMFSSFWQDEARSDFILGNPGTAQELISARTVALLTLAETRIGNFMGLPLPGNDRDADGLPGVVVPFDLYVRLQYFSNIYGGNLDWYFSPFYDRDYFKIRGLAGARVLRLNETFSFTGQDSGLGYTLQAVQNVGGNNNGQNNTNPFDLQVQTLDAAPYDIPTATGPASPITSYLASRTNGVFAGPEVGLRFDLGRDRFKIWTQSKFGLLAYQSQRKLNGYNIGDHYNIINNAALATASGLPQDPDVDGDGIADNPLRVAGIAGSTFSQSRTTTSVSPMFEQGLFMQAPLLSYVPIVNRMSMFEKADFNLGYSILVLGSVYRPSNDIDWAQFPNFPTVNDNKSKYYTTNWSLGVQWTY